MAAREVDPVDIVRHGTFAVTLLSMRSPTIVQTPRTRRPSRWRLPWLVIVMAAVGASCRWRYDLVDQQLGLPTDSGSAGALPGQSGSRSGDGGSNLGGEGTQTAGSANLGGGGTSTGAGQPGVGGAGNAGQGGTSAGRSGVGGGGNAGQAGSSQALPTGVTTLAGTGVQGFDNGPAASATFRQPMSVLSTPEGFYVADSGNAAVRLIAPDGTVSTVVGFAGSGFVDGPLLTAQLKHPSALARDSQGRILVADDWNHAIRRIEKNGTLSTVVGDGTAGYREGKGAGAQFREPQGMWLAGMPDLLSTHSPEIQCDSRA